MAKPQHLRAWHAPFFLLGLALFLYLLFRLFPALMDWLYSGFIYKYLSQALSWAVSLLPFSLAELSLYAAALLITYGVCRLLLPPLRRGRSFLAELRLLGGRLGRSLLWLAGIFLLTCGLNYHRLPLATHAGYEVATQSVETLEAMNYCLLARVRDLEKGLRHGPDGATRMEQSFDTHKQRVGEAYKALALDLPAVRGTYPATKAFMASPLMSYCQVMGFYFPFTLEANINNHVPAFWLPALMAHEQAHVRGFMREDEANFLVFLVGRESRDTEVAYSCYLHTFLQSSRALYRAAPEAYRRLMAGLGPHVQADLEANARYWEPFRTAWGRVAQGMNHVYLKANSQNEGLASYGKVVDLLLADYLRYPQKWEMGFGAEFDSNVLEIKSIHNL